MFRTACLKLTGYYVLFVMGLSLLITPWVYQLSTVELKKGLGIQMMETQQNIAKPGDVQNAKQDLNTELAAGRHRVLLQLVYGNIALFVIASIGGYVLARRTLRPIDRAMQTQDRFTADASHELRTPLATIKAQLEVALEEPAFDARANRTVLQSALEEIGCMSNLAEDLLLLVRPPKPQSELTGLDEVARRVIKRMRLMARDRQITLRLQASPSCIVRAERYDMERLLTTLVDNAIKHGPDHATVTVGVQRDGRRVTIAVHDEGPGIDSEVQRHLFERFYRVDQARQHNVVTQGHGLGLAIAQKLVIENRGSIRVHSAEGEGTSFLATLPAADPNE